MVYGIEVAKVGRRIRISSVWNCQTVILNCRASVLLECMSSPDGECRSVSYGFTNIRKSFAIVRKCKIGGCEHHYLSMTWAAPIHSKIGSNKPPKSGKWVVCSSWFARYQHGRSISSWNDELDARGFANWGWKRLLIDDWKTPVWHAQVSIFLVQKTIVLHVPSGVS